MNLELQFLNNYTSRTELTTYLVANVPQMIIVIQNVANFLGNSFIQPMNAS